MQSTPSLLLFLANEQLASGRPHAAFNHAEQCVFDANRSASLPNRDDVLRECRRASQRVRDESAVLVVRCSSSVGAEVELDGAAFGTLGVPVFVTAGVHVLRLRAPGYAEHREEIEARARETNERTITLDREEPQAATSPTAQTTAPLRPQQGSIVERPAPAVQRPRASGSTVAGAIALTVAGGVVMIAAAPLFALRNSALAGCSIEGETVVCDDQRAADHVPTARAFGAASIGALAGGAALSVSGAVWWIAVAQRRERRPTVALGPNSVIVSGVW